MVDLVRTSVTHSAASLVSDAWLHLVCHFVILTTFWRHLLSIFWTDARQHGILLRLLPTFAGVLRGNIRTRASFPKILANYISEESLINAVYNENMIEVTFPLRMSQEPVRRETTEGSCIEFIGYWMLQHEQNGCTLSFTRHQSGFFDIPIGWVDIDI